MKKQPTEPSGRLIYLEHQSRILRDNPLGDPAERSFPVYLPHAYNAPRTPNKRFAVLYDLVGYTGSGHSHVSWRNFDESVPEQLDRLIAEGKMPPCIVVFPDCFTSLGGNQYVNSSAIGRYADYLTRELIPFIDAELRTKADRNHRGCFGKSSGGYGAMVHGMQYSEFWGGIGNHSGDAYFEFVYGSEWPAVLTALQPFAPQHRGKKTQSASTKSNASAKTKERARQLARGFDDGRVAAFLDACWSNPKPSNTDVMTLMMLCMAATYDPDPKAPLGFRLPYDLSDGSLLPKRWAKWLRHDPVQMVQDPKLRKNLKSLKAIFIDCGQRDQYHIHFGTRQLSNTLQRYNIKHRYEEFDGTHSGIDYRMDVSLPYLARHLS